jgi:hypothetical protein
MRLTSKENLFYFCSRSKIDDPLVLDLFIAMTVAGFRPPRTPDTSVTDAYRRRMAEHLAKSLRRSWVMEKKPPLAPH